jgi:hypothetical protein
VEFLCFRNEAMKGAETTDPIPGTVVKQGYIPVVKKVNG